LLAIAGSEANQEKKDDKEYDNVSRHGKSLALWAVTGPAHQARPSAPFVRFLREDFNRHKGGEIFRPANWGKTLPRTDATVADAPFLWAGFERRYGKLNQFPMDLQGRSVCAATYQAGIMKPQGFAGR
jgi:hypothetical protein